MYVVQGLHHSLLGRPDIVVLNLLRSVNVIKEYSDCITPQHEFPELFGGLGKLEKEIRFSYEIESNHLPSAPRCVAIPLMPLVQKELAHMEELVVISRVEERTDWCAGMVVIPKSDDWV